MNIAPIFSQISSGTAMRALRLFVFFTLKAVSFVVANLVARDLHVQNTVLSPDGFSRSTVNSDSQIPAPLIFGNKGDQFVINVLDQLTDATMNRATSVHWHGIFQAHTAEMDGPAFVTQCPIIPGNAFRYNFTVPDQAGTYWYHSHLSTQYCDGLRGPLVIYDPNDPLKDMYDIDDESTVISLLDWYHEVAPSLFPNPTNATPTPDSTLINGQGRWSGSATPGPLAVVRAQVGKRHRLRVINMSCFPSFLFSIDGHNLTIIEADGVETVPYTVDALNIFAAQRYSLIVAMDKPVDNYWIRAIPSSPAGSTTSGGINSAILRYDGAPHNDPTSSATTNPVVMNEANLHPLINPGAPGQPFVGGADFVKTMQISRPGGLFEINGTPFIPPNVPVLLQILSGATSATSLLPSGSVYVLPPNKVIEINIPGGGNHPFHLHGHTFDVIRVSGSASYNFDNPVRRDTVSIGAGTDNVTSDSSPIILDPGFCIVTLTGIWRVFAEDPDDVATNDPPNSDWSNLCPTYNANNPDTGLH